MRNQARGAARRQLADNLVKIKLLAQQARKDKVDQEALFKLQEAYQIDNLLAVYFLNNYLKTAKIPDDDLRKYYDEHKADYNMIRARHILVRFKGSRVPLKPNQKDLTEEEALALAQDIRKRLVAGADFAQIAQQESDDPGSAAKGGDLGEFRRGQMIAAFDEAAGTLPINEISEPIKTPYGYHIIQVQAREAKSFEEVKDDIDKKLKPQLTDKLLADLRTKLGVMEDDSYFGPEPAPAPVRPAPK
jgi:parvulin-like peptidyl-prolyl isomerase